MFWINTAIGKAIEADNIPVAAKRNQFDGFFFARFKSDGGTCRYVQAHAKRSNTVEGQLFIGFKKMKKPFLK